jgi:hypothetical protein
MSLTETQRKWYENTLQMTKQEMEELDRLIEEELAKVKDRLAELQNAQKAPDVRRGLHASRHRQRSRSGRGARVHRLLISGTARRAAAASRGLPGSGR